MSENPLKAFDNANKPTLLMNYFPEFRKGFSWRTNPIMWRVSRAYHDVAASKSSVAMLVTFLVVGMLWAVYALHTTHYTDMSDSAHFTHIPLIVIKLPRSGSSWFTDSINSHPSVYLSKEIVQRSDTLWLKARTVDKDSTVTAKASKLSHFTSSAIQQHLIAALSRPRGKLSTSQSMFPSSRFVSDYIAHKTLKPFRSLKVLGFTLNLEHVADAAQIDWEAIMRAVPQTKVVLLLRSNLVKTAISGYTGSMNKNKQGCKEANLRSSSSTPGCNPVSLVDWGASALSAEVTIWQERYRNLISSVEKNPFLKKHLAHRFYYEELQVDQQAAFQALFTKIGMNSSEAGDMAATVAANSAQPEGNLWQKRGSDDLRDVLAKFDDIESELMLGGPNCDCLVQQLRDVVPRVRAECKAIWQADLKRCMNLN